MPGLTPSAAHASPLLLPCALLVLLGSLRGGVTSLAKYVSMQGVAPIGYVFWQAAIAAMLLTALCLCVRRRVVLSRAHLRYFAICATLGVALPNVVFFAVVRHVPAGSMAVILVTIPLLTYVLVVTLRMERLDKWRALGIVLGLIGSVLVVFPNSEIRQLDTARWLALGFLCPALYASVAVFASRHRVEGADPLIQAAGTMGGAALVLLPLALLTDTFYPLWQGSARVSWLIVAHGTIAAVAYSLFFVLLRISGPVFYSQSAYIIALSGIGFGMLVFGERHPSGFWLAVSFIFAGLMLVNMRQRMAVSHDGTSVGRVARKTLK